MTMKELILRKLDMLRYIQDLINSDSTLDQIDGFELLQKYQQHELVGM